MSSWNPAAVLEELQRQPGFPSPEDLWRVRNSVLESQRQAGVIDQQVGELEEVQILVGLHGEELQRLRTEIEELKRLVRNCLEREGNRDLRSLTSPRPERPRSPATRGLPPTGGAVR